MSKFHSNSNCVYSVGSVDINRKKLEIKKAMFLRNIVVCRYTSSGGWLFVRNRKQTEKKKKKPVLFFLAEENKL